MTDLVVDVPPIRNRFRDALAQQGLKPASETMHRGFDRAFRRPEAGGHGGVAPSRRLSQQARFELVELGRASLSGPLRAKVGEQAVDDRQCPAPLEERFGSRVILGSTTYWPSAFSSGTICQPPPRFCVRSRADQFER